MNGIDLLVDTNIIIYFLKGHENTKSLILDNAINISSITEIEVLGYWKHSEQDVQSIRSLFSLFRIVDINDKIKNTAIELRRRYRLKTPDSIIGATGLYLDIPIVSNDSDFFGVPDLTVIDYEL